MGAEGRSRSVWALTACRGGVAERVLDFETGVRLAGIGANGELRTHSRGGARSGRALDPLAHDLDDVFGIGPRAIAEVALEEALSARRDDLAVDQDVELARRTDGDLGRDAGGFRDVGRETRGAVAIASSTAVQDLDLHRRHPTARRRVTPHRSVGDRRRARSGRARTARPRPSSPASKRDPQGASSRLDRVRRGRRSENRRGRSSR